MGKIKNFVSETYAAYWVLLLALVFSGGFNEYVCCALATIISIFLIVQIVRNKSFTVSINITSISITTIVLFYLITCFYAVDSGMAFVGFLKFLPVVLYMLLLMQNKNINEKLIVLLPYTALVLGLLSLALVNIPATRDYFTVSDRLAGFFQYPNTFALFLLVGELAALNKEKLKPADIISVAILIVLLLFTGSRAVFVLAVFSNVLMVFFRKGKKVKIILTIVLAVLAVAVLLMLPLFKNSEIFSRYFTISFTESTFVGRLLYYFDAFPLILRHPFGLGYMGYYYVQQSIQTGIYSVDMTKVIFCNKTKNGKYSMPDSVTQISDKAFAACKNLTDVNISKNVTDVVYSAFRGCTSLTNVSLPSKVTKISHEAFAKCTSLKDISLPDNLESIGDSAFYGSGLAKVTIPDKVKLVDDYAFAKSQVQTITIGKSVETIGESAFQETSVINVSIPDNVKSLGKSCFYECESLIGVNLGSGLTEIKDETFAYTAVTNVSIPKNITRICYKAFENCKSLNDLAIKGENVEICERAFIGCPLEDYSPSENIAIYGDSSFRYSKIRNFHAGKTVTEIAYNSFGGCSELSDIQIPDTVLKISSCAFDGTKWYDAQPDGSVYLDHIYLRNKGESAPQNLTIKEGTKTIAEGALFYIFCGPTENIKTISLPNSLLRIGDLAFSGCTSLTEITIPASVEQIGDYAFLGCDSLTSINVDPDNKFYSSENGVLFNKNKTELIYCPKQNSGEYTVPNSIKTIKSLAFANSGIEKIVINRANTNFEKYAVGYTDNPSYPIASNVAKWGADSLNTTRCCVKGSTADQYVQNAKDNDKLKCEYIDPTIIIDFGDANGDGEINAKDRMTLTRYLAKWSGYESVDMTAADVNSDGDVNAKDRMILTRHIAKWSGYETLPYTK